MKTINNYLAGILISSAILTGCSKESQQVSPDPVNQGVNTAARSMDEETMVVQFSSGEAMATKTLITINGYDKYTSADGEIMNLFDPISQMTQIRPGVHERLELTMKAHPADGQPAFTLRGLVVSYDGSAIPLSFSINSPVTFYSALPSITVDDKTSLKDLMNIHSDIITGSITTEMWRSGMNADGEIVVNNRENPNLYRMILENLRTMLKIQVEV